MILKWIEMQNNNVIRKLISIFQSSLKVKCHEKEARKSNISYRLHTCGLTYIPFHALQKESKVAEGNEITENALGEHATLTQTISLKSVVGKYIYFKITLFKI